MAEEGAVTVCVRVRPLIERENAELGVKESISWKCDKYNISQVDGTKFFTFDRVFHSEESTAEVYKEVADPIIKSAVQGYNGTIFAYGQTASGKTYTMLGTKSSPGILPMAIEDVFKTICGIPDREFLLRISYMEIHNETIKDLLCSSIRKKKPLVVREDISRNIYVEDLIEEVVVSPEQVMGWLQKGEKNRHYGETKMNVRSSRSHTIFRMIIESKEKSDASNSNCDGAVMVSHLNLVDLAGSERASQTGTEGLRLKEGCNINRSLFILAQVIKKLCDDQTGGFINYRDSKLTRILQNSLGGNAKTAIICTVTPVSLEETLSTLQFASTAKKMKNSPKVNEVLDDDALLKRYRREIEDLKRRLEEVSSVSHTRNEEKDQLAQLLEEKNSLQEQQTDRIRTLAEMVVTSSSFLQEQELKSRKKRRVTWAPGQISRNRGILSENFPGRAKRFKTSVSALSEMEESVSSEFSEYDDHCLAVTATIPEEEWVPAPEMNLLHKDFEDSVYLCETLAVERDIAVSKQHTTQAELDTLQLEKEQLSQEVRELTEKIETNEFMVLEKETSKEHEMQLMHEISNLKAVIANAEGYNQDLQTDLTSKELQLQERESKITALEKQIIELNTLLEESRKTNSRSMHTSLTETPSQMVDEMKQSLNDAEIVAMDAKKESAFLRSENLALKERMDQLLDDYNCMKKDVDCYRSQVEAGKVTYKKMQSDLQKELQYYFQENANLTSLLEGKPPKDYQTSVELDEKIVHLKNELNKALEENASLRKEVAVLSDMDLKVDFEILNKEILEKSETIASLTSERETLLSQVAEKEQMLLQMTDVVESKEDFVNAEAARQNNEIVQELKHQYCELEQELSTVSEENKQMQAQIESLSAENIKLNANLSEVVQELSSKEQELQAKVLEHNKLLCMEEELSQTRQELNDTEQLKVQLKALDSQVEAGEAERRAVVQQLHGREDEISALAQERDELKQMLEELQREKDQIKGDIEETVAMNIEAQNELRSSQISLKQYQKDIKELQATILKKESEVASIRETLETTINEQQLEILKLTDDLEQATLEKNRLSAGEALLEENNQLQLMREQIFCLEEEKAKLQQQLETLQEEKKLTSLILDSLAKGTQEEELLGTKEVGQPLQKLSEMAEQLKTTETGKEVDKRAMAQELCKHEEAVRALLQERDHLKHEQDALRLEMAQVQEAMQATQLMVLEKSATIASLTSERETLLSQVAEKEQMLLQMTDVMESKEDFVNAEAARQNNETVQELKRQFHELGQELSTVSEENKWMEAQIESLSAENIKLNTSLNEMVQELSSKEQELQAKVLEHNKLLCMEEELSQARQELNDTEQLKVQLKASDSQVEAGEAERWAVVQQLHGREEEISALAQERDELKQMLEELQREREQIKGDIEETVAMFQKDIKELQATILKKESEVASIRETLETTINEQKLEILKLTDDLEQATLEKNRLSAREALLEENNELQLMREQIFCLEEEKAKLQQQLETLQEEKDLGQESHQWLPNKIQELQSEARELLQTKEQLCGEALQNQREMEELKEQLRVLESKLQAEEMEKLNMAERLHGGEEERKSLVLERDDLKQKWDGLQIEKEKLQEQLKALESKLEARDREKLEMAEKLQDGEAERKSLALERDDLKQKWDGLQIEKEKLKEQLKALESKLEAEEMERLNMAERLHGGEEERKSLVLEWDDLKQRQGALQIEKEKLKEELKALESKLEAGEREKLEMAERLQDGEAERKSLALERDDLKQKWDGLQIEKEKLKEQLKALESRLEPEEMERLNMAERLHCGEVERKSLVLEWDDLKQRQGALQIEKEKLKEELKALESKLEAGEREKLEMAERLQDGEAERKSLALERDDLKQKWDGLQIEKEKLKEQLKALESKLEAEEMEKLNMAERLHGGEEERKSLVLERDDLKQRQGALQIEKEKLKGQLKALESKLEAEEMEKLNMAERLHGGEVERKSLVLEWDDLKQRLGALQIEKEKLKGQLKALESKLEAGEREKLEMAERLQDGEAERKSLALERDDLKQKWNGLQIEKEKLKEQLKALESKLEAEEMEKLNMAERLHGGQEERKSLVLERDDLKQRLGALQIKKEKLKGQLKALESKLEAGEREKLEMAERLQDGEAERKSLALERDDLKQKWDGLQIEKEKLRKLLEETSSKGLELQEQLKNTTGSLKEYQSIVEELRGENSQASKMQENLSQTIEHLKRKVVDTQREAEKLLEKAKYQEQQTTRSLMVKREEELQKREAELAEKVVQLKEKVEQLTEKLRLQIAESNRLLAEQEAEAKSMQQLEMENSVLKNERDSLQQAMETVKGENNQLRSNLPENTEKDLHELRQQREKATQEKTLESKEQDNLVILQAKVSKITEALQKFPGIEKRYECLGRTALNLKTNISEQKAPVAKDFGDVSHEKAKQIKKLQVEHEVVINSLHRLLNKVQFLLTRLCKKKGEYYVNISNYTMELLGEKKKQLELLTQMQSLKKSCCNSQAAVSQQLHIPELNQNLDFYVEQIWKDVSQMDEDAHSIEVMLQQLENDGRKVRGCSVASDVQDFETEIKQDSERMLHVGRLLKPKGQVLMDIRAELDTRNADYCRETEATLKACQERTQELFQEFKRLKEQRVPRGSANLILEEENYKLESKLKAQDQDMKDLKLKIQELDHAAKEAGKNLLEKEKKIAVLEMELKVRASKNEVVRLRATLEEKENCLTTTLMENQTLRAQVNKGAELYKEEIEDLKTQLAKADMAIMKQSKCFDREMANAKALAEHRGEQLRKLKEKQRRAQHEQDVTVMLSKDVPQPSLPITCGGGSGIVQNTQLLVLKSEHVKLEREICQLKKEHELVLKNELLLKEEVKKWKERALKLREQSRGIDEEQRLKSPRKTAPPSLTEPFSSPSKECSLRPVLPVDTPTVPLNYPTTFFDNSSLGAFNDAQLAGDSTETASSENNLKHWMARANKENAPECKTQ